GGADQGAADDGQRERCPGVHAIAHLQHGGDIGAGAEEGGVTGGIMPAITAEQVPPLPHQRDHQRDAEEAARATRDQQRHRDEPADYKRNAHETVAQGTAAHTACPNRPRGRSSRTRMKMTKMPSCPSDSPRNRPLRLSPTPMRRPPTSAPGAEPMPPSTTM